MKIVIINGSAGKAGDIPDFLDSDFLKAHGLVKFFTGINDFFPACIG